MPLLELLNFTKTWPTLEVCASLTVKPGSMLAIVGHSGCGKSTLLRMIAGLLPADGGAMLMDGIDVHALAPRERNVGMVFQDHALFPHLNVRKNVEYGLVCQGVKKNIRSQTALVMLDSMDLAGFGRRSVSELSGGEKQRVALARTLVTKPRVVLFDEPLSSLDEGLRKRLRNEIRDTQQRFGLTAIYVTHDLEEALAIADSVAIMDSGGILQCSPPRELWENPANARAARFLGNGVVLPVKRIEQVSDGSMRAHTDAGIFRLPGLPKQGIQTENAKPLSVYFSRSACRLHEKHKTAMDGSAAAIEARCIRSDYSGDTVECLMESGESAFTVRFEAGLKYDQAPQPGKTCSLTIPGNAIRILPE